MLLTTAVDNKETETNSASRIIMLAALCNKESKIIILDATFFQFVNLFNSFHQIKKSTPINSSRKINRSPTSYSEIKLVRDSLRQNSGAIFVERELAPLDPHRLLKDFPSGESQLKRFTK